MRARSRKASATMTMLVLLVILVACSFWVGYRVGGAEARDKAIALCLQVVRENMSGSVRRIMNALVEKRDRVRSEDEFFGPKQ